MPITIDKPVENPVKTISLTPPKKKRAANKPIKIPNPVQSDKPITIQSHTNSLPSKGNPINISMEEQVTKFAKSTYNPEFEKFESFVDEVRREVRKTVDYRKSQNDDDPVTISNYTNETIKRILRSSNWA